MPAHSNCAPNLSRDGGGIPVPPPLYAASVLMVHYEVVPSFVHIYYLIQLKKN